MRLSYVFDVRLYSCYALEMLLLNTARENSGDLSRWPLQFKNHTFSIYVHFASNQ